MGCRFQMLWGHTFVFGDIDLRKNKNSSGDEIANVNFLRRYGTYVLQITKKREPTSFNQLDDS